MNETIKAFIFDLDGTLIDTEKIYRMLWPKAIEKYGSSMSDDQFLELRSLGRPFVVDKFREWFGDDFDYVEARNYCKSLFDEYIGVHGIEVKPGAIELLEFLHKQGVTTAIATATDLDKAESFLVQTGLRKYFDRIISAKMVTEGKPSPLVYQYAVEQLGLEPSECVAVEDAPNGVRSAAGAGLRVIMVPDLTEPDGELCKLIWKKCSSLEDIIQITHSNQ